MIEAKANQVLQKMGLVVSGAEHTAVNLVGLDPATIAAILAAAAQAIVQVIQAIAQCKPATGATADASFMLGTVRQPSFLQRLRLGGICRLAMAREGVPFRHRSLAPSMRDAMIAVGIGTSQTELDGVVVETAGLGGLDQ